MQAAGLHLQWKESPQFPRRAPNKNELQILAFQNVFQSRQQHPRLVKHIRGHGRSSKVGPLNLQWRKFFGGQQLERCAH